jgi:hypothetical protein
VVDQGNAREEDLEQVIFVDEPSLLLVDGRSIGGVEAAVNWVTMARAWFDGHADVVPIGMVVSLPGLLPAEVVVVRGTGAVYTPYLPDDYLRFLPPAATVTEVTPARQGTLAADEVVSNGPGILPDREAMLKFLQGA